MGILAGVSAKTVDFSALGINLWLILAIVIVLDSVILILAYKKGRFGGNAGT